MTDPDRSADQSDRAELRRLARGGFGGMLAAVVSGLGGLAFVLIAARGYVPSEVGTVFTLTSLYLIVDAIVVLGSDIGVTRLIAVKLAADRRDQVPGVLVGTLLPTLTLSLVAALVVWITAPTFAGAVGGGVGAADLEIMIRALAVILPFGVISHAVLAATRGLGTVRPTLLVESVLRQGSQPVLAGAAVLAGLDLRWLLIAWAAPYVAATCAAVAAYRRLCRRRGLRAWISPRAPQMTGIWSEVWRFNAPRALTQVAQLSIRRADIPLVTLLAGPSAAAVYTAASRFVAAGLQAVRGVQQMVGPQLARLVEVGRIDQASLALRTATTWNILIAWPIYLTCAAYPLLVLSLFGPGYADGQVAVIILAAGMLVGIASGPVDIALLMLGRSVLSLQNNLLALLTNLVLNLALIPVWGINGAATAWAVSILVGNILPTWQIRPTLGAASDRFTALATGVTLAAFGVVPALAIAAGVASLPAQAATIATSAAVYVALAWWLRRPLRLIDLGTALRTRRTKRPRPRPFGG